VPRYLFPERGIEICQRYGTRWLPIEGALPKLLVPAGTILLFYALLLTMWIVAEILKDRMLHRILSHLLCPTQQAGRSG
jgi:hypothetical protein